MVRLAEQQFGRIARRQLTAIGLTPGRIRYWLEEGRLRPMLPGVYALGHATGGPEAELSAALLYAGSGSALARQTALWWTSLLEVRPAVIDIDAPGRARSRGDIAIHHPARVDARLHRDLPVVAVATALLDSAGKLEPRRLRKALAEAEFLGLLNLSEVRAGLGRGRPGSAALRGALAVHMPQLAHVANDFETDFLFLLERHSLPLPEVNARVGRLRPDMLWRDRGLAVELDGRDAHTTPAQIANDRDRDLMLRTMGFTVVRYTWNQVRFEPDAVARDIQRLLGA